MAEDTVDCERCMSNFPEDDVMYTEAGDAYCLRCALAEHEEITMLLAVAVALYLPSTMTVGTPMWIKRKIGWCRLQWPDLTKEARDKVRAAVSRSGAWVDVIPQDWVIEAQYSHRNPSDRNEYG